MKRFNFYLPEDLVKTLREIAKQKDTTYSDLIRRILLAYVKQQSNRDA